jgi:hypothetical protein
MPSSQSNEMARIFEKKWKGSWERSGLEGGVLPSYTSNGGAATSSRIHPTNIVA